MLFFYWEQSSVGAKQNGIRISVHQIIQQQHSVHRLIISACFNFLTIWCSLQFGACMQCPHDILQISCYSMSCGHCMQAPNCQERQIVKNLSRLISHCESEGFMQYVCTTQVCCFVFHFVLDTLLYSQMNALVYFHCQYKQGD